MLIMRQTFSSQKTSFRDQHGLTKTENLESNFRNIGNFISAQIIELISYY